MSQYIHDFKYIYNEAPISHWIYPATAVVGYGLSLYLLPLYMKKVRNNTPMKHPLLEMFIKFHNIFLSVLSLIMVLGFVGEAVEVVNEIPEASFMEKLSALTCDVPNRMGKGAVPFWLYIFYLSKYYELLDTVFLMIKCKSLTFLHTFHHMITLLLCWYVILEKSQMMWFPSTLNAGVHVIMYFYFYVCTVKNSPIFTPGCLNVIKPWITRMQIIQFVFDLVVPKVWLWFKYGDNQTCAGNYYPFFLVDLTVAAFLALFLNFYIQSYKRKKTDVKKTE
ncbi:predicted protein [Naegleria gruberi]|uniref:Elongation of fatty acids protein n=1 Tax=Naegleria gruberi TaxID=5762 RepID=D2VVU2_NAEGR|nr:uncharacterized protein NAEGRDRAFT_73141 [Naegleria gruberi]EFC39165.1 predicted protein [Naegleria gruberi]|eukprot:XP_002671909.1 predicted protein [Naegleria gruberi strain NEG-M]